MWISVAVVSVGFLLLLCFSFFLFFFLFYWHLWNRCNKTSLDTFFCNLTSPCLKPVLANVITILLSLRPKSFRIFTLLTFSLKAWVIYKVFFFYFVNIACVYLFFLFPWLLIFVYNIYDIHLLDNLILHTSFS